MSASLFCIALSKESAARRLTITVLHGESASEQAVSQTHSNNRCTHSVLSVWEAISIHVLLFLCSMTNNLSQFPFQPHLPLLLFNELLPVISHYRKPDYPTGILHTLTENFLKVTFSGRHRNHHSLCSEMLSLYTP